MEPLTTMVEELGSDKALALLNDIDELLSHGISQYINLPQLISCGDPSSGKSSVLEAISGIPFPNKDNLCARTATEVIPDIHQTSISLLRSCLAPARSEEEQAKLLNFDTTWLSWKTQCSSTMRNLGWA